MDGAPGGLIDEQDWAGARRVLCLRLDNVGDVLMTTPALRALRAQRPDRHLSLLASRAGAALAPHLSMCDEVLVHEASWVGRPHHDDDAALLRRLAQGGYDAAVIFTVCTQSALPAALMCRLAGIRLRLAHCRENPYALLTHWRRDPDDLRAGPVRHEVQRQLDLVASVGAHGNGDDPRLSFDLRRDDRIAFEAAARRIGLSPEQPWVLLHPGASAPSRRYPPESFAQVARRLHAETGLSIVFGGAGSQESACIESIRAQAGVPTHSLAGLLDLGGYAAAVESAAVVVTSNSAPAHLAAALNTPVVVPYALTNPQHTPWRVPSRVLWSDVPCRNCLSSRCRHAHHPCLRGVTPRAVTDATLSLLEARSAQGVAA